MRLEGLDPVSRALLSVLWVAWPLAFLKGFTLITPTNSLTKQDLGVFLWCFLSGWNVGFMAAQENHETETQAPLPVSAQYLISLEFRLIHLLVSTCHHPLCYPPPIFTYRLT